ncbi:MAG: hypothetical protein HFH73_05605 [Lachnospiraceae bacterium]|nr:hypothetical protein [Lachnospiraceae bacterium]
MNYYLRVAAVHVIVNRIACRRFPRLLKGSSRILCSICQKDFGL